LEVEEGAGNFSGIGIGLGEIPIGEGEEGGAKRRVGQVGRRARGGYCC